MKILVASNDLTFNPALVSAYRDAGHEVHAGVPNFLLALGKYDIVHFHWPEELVGFGINSANPLRTRDVLNLIDRYKKNTVLVATAHNLVPHAADTLESPQRAYFAQFYERMDVICHFSKYSLERFAETYRNLSSIPQLVHGLNSYDHLLQFTEGPVAARQALGLPTDEFVFSVIGAMRKAEELTLVRQGWTKARLSRAHLLFASDPPWHVMQSHHRLIDKAKHRRWLGANRRVRNVGGNLDDRTLVKVIEASDALIVPRFGLHLNSGLVPLALTFGTAVIAPDYGVCSEHVPKSANSLYKPGDAHALALALRRQIGLDREQVRSANLHLIRSTGGWANIIASVWPTIMERGRSKGIIGFDGSDAGE